MVSGKFGLSGWISGWISGYTLRSTARSGREGGSSLSPCFVPSPFHPVYQSAAGNSHQQSKRRVDAGTTKQKHCGSLKLLAKGKGARASPSLPPTTVAVDAQCHPNREREGRKLPAAWGTLDARSLASSGSSENRHGKGTRERERERPI